MTEYYAHSVEGRPKGEWELLEDHLRRVAEGEDDTVVGAAGHAASFGGGEWARLLGWWHDLGKYSDAFQNYLSSRSCTGGEDSHRGEIAGKVDHSTAGAQHAARLGPLGVILAYCIAGHHAGLPDDAGGEASLSMRLKKRIEPYSGAPADLLDRSPPPPPKLRTSGDRRRDAFGVAFFTRMLFSCLVDADFLATEQIMSRDRAGRRRGRDATLAPLLARLDEYLDCKQREAPKTPVNHHRRQVLAACRDMARLPPGVFSLNVPTGGGKTLSSLAFALMHAVRHDLSRIIYAIPFTSIIEQTASVFREALDDLADEVLEHHSSLDLDDPKKHSQWSRMAAENFDARLIVTTNVEFFESLFASSTSRCRKLHRLARSVIILDEAQALPASLLAPTLAALDELVRNYSSTVVLCTATQPAIEFRDNFQIGLKEVTPIIGDVQVLHRALVRTEVEHVGMLPNEELAGQLANENQVLCVVNSRRHATDLFRLLDDRAALHLSASMCAAHRATVVAEIRRRLDAKANEPCRVISTQVIEAGVDVDFPVVYRAAAGLDSVAQAAGRCNREGRLRNSEGSAQLGRVVVFDYDTRLYRTERMIEVGAGHFREVAPEHASDLLSPQAIEAYFRLHYWQQGGDDGHGWDTGRGGHSVMICFGGDDGDPLHHQFREAADRYQLIDDSQIPVLVPYGERGRSLIAELRRMRDPLDPARLRAFDRAAQRFVVGVRERSLRVLLDQGIVQEQHGRCCLADPIAYDKDLGLALEAERWNPERLVV